MRRSESGDTVLLGLNELEPRADTAFARSILQRWNPPDAEQAATRDRIVAWIDRYPKDAHTRTRLEGHLTASALVVDASRERGLLTHHKKLGRWLQLGGHCDGDANLPHVALREALEESGLVYLAVDPVPIDVDIHTIPSRHGARGPEPEHWHLDTRFVVFATREAELVLSDESLELAWVTPAELAGLSTDASVMRLFERVFGP